jgi:hypothetical protein
MALSAGVVVAGVVVAGVVVAGVVVAGIVVAGAERRADGQRPLHASVSSCLASRPGWCVRADLAVQTSVRGAPVTTGGPPRLASAGARWRDRGRTRLWRPREQPRAGKKLARTS